MPFKHLQSLRSPLAWCVGLSALAHFRLDVGPHLAVLFRLNQDFGIFTVLFRLELNFVNHLLSVLFFAFNIAAMDFASAATSAQMNPAEVIQHLMAGVCMETGYEHRDVKLKVNVTENSDTRAWAMLNEHDENIEVEFVMLLCAKTP